MRKSTLSVPGGLLVACAGLLWLNLANWHAPSAKEAPSVPNAPQSRLDATLPDPPQFDAPILARFTETLERPLFTPTRRPPKVEAAAPVPQAPRVPLDLTLKGVIFSPDERVAIFAPKSGRVDRKVLRLPEGASYEGWTLETIAPKAAIFRRGKTEEQLELLFDEATPNRQRKRRSRRPKARAEG